MVRLSDPRRLARRRLLALACQVPLALSGDADGVHQARVASRRLREFLPLLAAGAAERRRLTTLRRQVRRLTRALGPVRELDVALLALDDLAAGAPENAAAAAAVRITVAEARAAAFDSMTAAVTAVSLDKLRRRVGDAATNAADAESRRGMAGALAARLGERCLAMQAALDAAGTIYAPDRLHQVRIAAKKVRYSLELAQELGRSRLAGTLRRLKLLQDILGALHDGEILAVRVRDSAAAVPVAADRVAFDALAGHLDAEVRRRHGDFLREREALPSVFYWAHRVGLGLDPSLVKFTRQNPGPARGEVPAGPEEAG